jgi:hypothetical protein
LSFRVRSIRAPGWYWIRSELLRQYGPEIGAYGIAVYNVLAMCADNDTQEAYPGLGYIANLCGCSIRQVQRKIRRMEELGLIAIESTKTETGADGPNHYWLLSLREDDRDTGYIDRETPNEDSQAHELDPFNYTWINQILPELQLQMTKGAFNRWLAGSTAARDDDIVTVFVRDHYAVEWLQAKWLVPIQRTLSGVVGKTATVEFEEIGNE